MRRRVSYKTFEDQAPADDLARNGENAFTGRGVISTRISCAHMVSGTRASWCRTRPIRSISSHRDSSDLAGTLAAAPGPGRPALALRAGEHRWAFARSKIDFFVGIRGRRDSSSDSSSSPSRPWQVADQFAGRIRLDGVEVVFRPRPANSTERIRSFFREHVGEDFGAIHVIKEGSVREWIVASDLVVSSYSTSLIEAAIASGLPTCSSRFPCPRACIAAWYDFAPRACGRPTSSSPCCAAHELEPPCAALVSWATENLLPVADPIRRCVEDLAELCSVGGPRPAPGGLSSQLSTRKYFNEETHEMDALSADEVQQLVAALGNHLAPEGTQSGDTMTSSTMTPLHKTMDRDDLLSTEGQQLVGELNDLIERSRMTGVAPSSWVRGPSRRPRRGAGAALLRRVAGCAEAGARAAATRWIRARRARSIAVSSSAGSTGRSTSRPTISAIRGSSTGRIFWVLHLRPLLRPGMSLLDAGGSRRRYSPATWLPGSTNCTPST